MTFFLTALNWNLLPAQDVGLLTRAERSAFRETSRYEDVVDFLKLAAEKTSLVQLTQFGYTLEGRSLPLAIVSRDGLRSPDAIRASGRTVVYLQGNIHGGEVCGKEALMMLLREIIEGGHRPWLDSMVLLVAPIYNADGNERIRLTNRPRQNGPLGGMGQRPNAQNLDLNRDHMKLESPEARSLARLFGEYDPHVGFDLHTTNGTRHAYYLTYSPPLNPNTPKEIDDLLRGRWLPWVTESVRTRFGWEFYYYGNVPGGRGGSRENGWYTFDHRPRFNNSYVGLRNRFGILSEAYAYATFEDRVLASLRFVRENLRFIHENGAEIRRTTAELDRRRLIGERLATRAVPARSAEPVEILMGEVETYSHPYTGQAVLNRLDVQRRESMYEYGTFEASRWQAVPAAYLIPDRLAPVVELLQAHGIRVERMGAPSNLTVERFEITATEVAPREFQGHQERTIEGSYRSIQSEVEGGTWQVPMDQPLARLAFYLLEPESDDGVLNWNMLDGELESGHYPILRLIRP